MKQSNLRKIACITLCAFSFCLGFTPCTAFAESTNIVAETYDKTELSVSQIKQLAVIYNPTNKTYELNQDILDLNERITEKSKKKIRNNIDNLDDTDSSTVDDLKAALENTAGKTEAEIADLKQQLAKAEAELASANAALDSQFDSLVDQLGQVNDTLDKYEEEKDDLDKTISDWEVQVGMIAEVLCMQVAQYDQNISILEKQIALSEKSLKLAEVQKELGMSLTTDIVSSQASLAETQQNLASAKESRSNLLRQINVLIGREQNSELSITGTDASVVLNDIPTYSAELVAEIAAQDYTIVKYNRTIENYKDDADDTNSSTEKESIENSIQSVRLQMEEYERTLDSNVKSKLAKMASDKSSYESSQKKVTVERKNYELAQVKYDLGMITGSELTQAEISYENAFNTYWKNKWNYYLDWQEYKAMKDGIDLSTYSKYRM